MKYMIFNLIQAYIRVQEAIQCDVVTGGCSMVDSTAKAAMKNREFSNNQHIFLNFTLHSDAGVI